ncbi:MAG: TonB-dependent receptor [Sandaracinaceae bacterium]|nr:TonB-dependent receptor [Sandaracinaceae bacterium]
MRGLLIAGVLGLALVAAPRAQAQVLVAPRLIEAPEVSAPAGSALAADASVLVELTIDEDGGVAEATVIETPEPALGELVLEAARRARFAPATRDGVPVRARVRFRYAIAPAPGASEAPEAPEAPEAVEAAEPAPAEPDAPAPSLEVRAPDAPELGVTAQVERRETGAAERITLRGAELTTVPGTFGDPVRVVAALPGVARSPFGVGYFLVRGANFQNTGYFIDGFPVPILYHLVAGPAVLHGSLVEEMHFYPGGYPVSYGRYTAGIVALETAPIVLEREFRAEVQIDGYRGSVLATLVLPDRLGSISASFRRSYYDLVFPIYQEVYGRAAEDLVHNPFAGIQFYYLDVAVRAELRLSDRVRASVLVLGSEDSFDQRGSLAGGRASEGARTNLGIDFQRAIVRLRVRLDEGATLSIAGMLGRDGNRFDSAQPGRESLRFEQESFIAGLRVDASVRWSPEVQTRFGLDVLASLFGLSATLPTPPGFGEYPRPIFDPRLLSVGQTLVSQTAALYLEQVFLFSPVELSLGGRFELMNHAIRTDAYPDPRAVARWQVVPELAIKAASGLFSQPPNPYSASPRGGNPALPAERSWQSSLGVEATLPESIEARVTGYYTRFFQLTRATDAITTAEDGQLRRVTALGDGQGQAYGLEVLLRRRLADGLFGWLSYTLSRSERFLEGGRVVPFQFDQTHVLNLAASYGFDGWRFGVRFQLATGAWTTRVDGAAFDADAGAYSPYRRGLSERLPLYHRLDVRMDREFRVGPLRGAVFVDIQNIYNAPSQEGVLYQYDFRATEPLPGIPILPTVGVSFFYEPGFTDREEAAPPRPEAGS